MDNQPLFPDNEVRPLKVICIALPAGVTLMYLVVLTMMQPATSTGLDTNSLTVLRMIHVVGTLLAVALQRFQYERVLSGKLFSRSRLTGLPLTFSQRYRLAVIARLAPLEGAALFGAVLMIIAAGSGALQRDATLYLHAIPLLLLIQAAISCYPSAGKIAELTREYQG